MRPRPSSLFQVVGWHAGPRVAPCERLQLIREQTCGLGKCLGRADGSIRLDVEHQPVEAHALPDPGVLDHVVDPAHRGEGGIQADDGSPERTFTRVAPKLARHMAAAELDLDLHVQQGTWQEFGDHMLRVEHPHAHRGKDVAGADLSCVFSSQGQVHFPATFQAEDHALEIEQQVQDVLRHAVW